MVSCQKGPTRHAYAWQIGPFWQDTLEITTNFDLDPQTWLYSGYVLPVYMCEYNNQNSPQQMCSMNYNRIIMMKILILTQAMILMDSTA